MATLGEATRVSDLLVPTAPEMLRVKAFLLTERRATRDYIDVAALALHLGSDAALEAVGFLSLVYGPREPQTWVSAFAEACESEPLDLASVALAEYKGLEPPLNAWPFVAARCRDLGRAVLKRELVGALPEALPTGWGHHSKP